MLAASTQKPTSLSSHLIDADNYVYGAPAISQCKTRCYLPCGDCLLKVALPGGEVVRKVDCASWTLFSCGSVVVSYGKDGVSVYDEDLTLLCSLSHEECVTLLLAQKEYDVVCLKELKASQTGDIGFDVYTLCMIQTHAYPKACEGGDGIGRRHLRPHHTHIQTHLHFSREQRDGETRLQSGRCAILQYAQAKCGRPAQK